MNSGLWGKNLNPVPADCSPLPTQPSWLSARGLHRLHRRGIQGTGVTEQVKCQRNITPQSNHTSPGGSLSTVPRSLFSSAVRSDGNGTEPAGCRQQQHPAETDRVTQLASPEFPWVSSRKQPPLAGTRQQEPEPVTKVNTEAKNHQKKLFQKCNSVFNSAQKAITFREDSLLREEKKNLPRYTVVGLDSLQKNYQHLPIPQSSTSPAGQTQDFSHCSLVLSSSQNRGKTSTGSGTFDEFSLSFDKHLSASPPSVAGSWIQPRVQRCWALQWLSHKAQPPFLIRRSGATWAAQSWHRVRLESPPACQVGLEGLTQGQARDSLDTGSTATGEEQLRKTCLERAAETSHHSPGPSRFNHHQETRHCYCQPDPRLNPCFNHPPAHLPLGSSIF